MEIKRGGFKEAIPADKRLKQTIKHKVNLVNICLVQTCCSVKRDKINNEMHQKENKLLQSLCQTVIIFIMSKSPLYENRYSSTVPLTIPAATQKP